MDQSDALSPHSGQSDKLSPHSNQSDELSPHSDQSDVGIDEGDHDVPGAVGGGQALVLVRQSAGVHQHPAQPGGGHRALVAGEVHPAALGDRVAGVSK